MKKIHAVLFIFLLLPNLCVAKTVAPKESAPTPTNQFTWTSLSPTVRSKIVDAWQALPELTRPPFPLFVEQYQEKQNAPAPTKNTAKK